MAKKRWQVHTSGVGGGDWGVEEEGGEGSCEGFGAGLAGGG